MIGGWIVEYGSGPVCAEFGKRISNDYCECGVVGRFYLPDDYIIHFTKIMKSIFLSRHQIRKGKMHWLKSAIFGFD